MAATTAPETDLAHDESLLDWFLSLTPTERLAELESRVAFFNQVRRDVDRQLPSHSRSS